MKRSPEKEKGREEEVRRKQIEGTLNQLHRLQAEIYDLNIPDNPHSSAPVKKEVKQLTYLYENMIKPKTKNNLDVPQKDIEEVINFIDGAKDREGPATVDTKKLSALMKGMFGVDLEVGLLKKGDSKAGTVTAQELFEFINYNEFDDFDPIEESYSMLMDEQGRMNFDRYQELNAIMGLPAIPRESSLRETLQLSTGQELTLSQFKDIVKGKTH